MTAAGDLKVVGLKGLALRRSPILNHHRGLVSPEKEGLKYPQTIRRRLGLRQINQINQIKQIKPMFVRWEALRQATVGLA